VGLTIQGGLQSSKYDTFIFSLLTKCLRWLDLAPRALVWGSLTLGDKNTIDLDRVASVEKTIAIGTKIP